MFSSVDPFKDIDAAITGNRLENDSRVPRQVLLLRPLENVETTMTTSGAKVIFVEIKSLVTSPLE